MRYRHDYCTTHDVDWFATYKGIPIHIASNGMMIPDFIDSKKNREIQQYVSGLSEMFAVFAPPQNNLNIESLYDNREDALYAYQSSFKYMACRGFWSFDSIRDEYSHLEYRLNLVAAPHSHFTPDGDDRLEYVRGLLPEIPEDFAQLVEQSILRAMPNDYYAAR